MEAPRDAGGPAVAVAVAVVRHAGRVLIGQRPADAPLAGMWEFPGGKVRQGESPREAALRECLEETGLAVHIVGIDAQLDHAYKHGRLRLHFLAAEPVDPDALPAAPFRWVPVTELDRYRFPAANAAVFRFGGCR